MREVSELVGSVINGTPTLNRTTDDDEKFYTIDVSFYGTNIPVLFSSYVNSQSFEKDSKIKVTGSVMSDMGSDKLPVFYFYANAIEVVDKDTNTSNEIFFSYKVIRVKEFTQNNRGVDILPLIGNKQSPLDTWSLAFLCARGSVARKLKDVPAGYTIEGRGYLKQFRDVYEIFINEVTNLDEILTNK